MIKILLSDPTEFFSDGDMYMKSCTDTHA